MAVAGRDADTIKTVHSHVHALGQCRKVIRELGLTPLVSGDTAGAAREIAEAHDPTQAALAPPLAAEIYGLEVLREDVEDEDHNTTRFVVLSRDYVEAPPDDGPVVTSFIFNVRNLPAALYKALGGFATNGVNMTKLESYMVDGRFTATQFLAEVDGHPEDVAVRNALEELEFFTTDVKILGVYPAAPFRACRDRCRILGGFCIRLNSPSPAGRSAPPSGRCPARRTAPPPAVRRARWPGPLPGRRRRR